MQPPTTQTTSLPCGPFSYGLFSHFAFWEKIIVLFRIISQLLWKSLCDGVCFPMNIRFLSFWLASTFWCWFRYSTWELRAHNCSVSTSGCSFCSQAPHQHLLRDIWCVREKCVIIIYGSAVYGKYPCHWLLWNINRAWHSRDGSGSIFYSCLISSQILQFVCFRFFWMSSLCILLLDCAWGSEESCAFVLCVIKWDFFEVWVHGCV